jgi:UDP-N-acetylglucosamine 4,6-dehydratase
MKSPKNIFMTGGTGTLGGAIVQHIVDFKRHQMNPDITVYSRDPMRQSAMRQKWPWIHFVIGDVRDKNSLIKAMAGHDFVLNLSAMKHIPQAEQDPDACFEINVIGSRNVLDAAIIHGIKDVVLISTDKACRPINAYGMSKAMMERYGFAYAGAGLNVYIPRYGNVIESTGSVVAFWKKQIEQGKPLSITDPEMTRFWITPRQAAEIVFKSLEYPGLIYIPKQPALSIGKMAAYLFDAYDFEVVGLRPGEKIHEELLTREESAFAINDRDFFLLKPPTSERHSSFINYSSDKPKHELSREELRSMLELDD